MKHVACLILFTFTALAVTAQSFTAIRGGAALSNLKYKVESNNRARITWFGGIVANSVCRKNFL